MVTTPKLSAELARATEAAAVAVHALVGGGDLEKVDRAAVDAMRTALRAGHLLGRVAIGEGEKDGAPMLHNEEIVGRFGGTPVDLAVDPIDGTRAAALGAPGSVSALAAAPAGRMFRPGPIAYMEKVIGPPGADLQLDMSSQEMVTAATKVLGIPVEQLRVAILDRPRNAARMKEVRATGAQVLALPYADLSACIAVASSNANIHLLAGIGGCAEGVIAAVAASVQGATMQCRLWPRDTRERERAEAEGLSCSEVLDAESMVGTSNLSVVLTGVTGNELLNPIAKEGSILTVHSLRIESGHAPVFTWQTFG